jgi:hypothetical protein
VGNSSHSFPSRETDFPNVSSDDMHSDERRNFQSHRSEPLPGGSLSRSKLNGKQFAKHVTYGTADGTRSA